MNIEIESHLRHYLTRVNEVWTLYNICIKKWILAHPNNDGVPQEGAFPEVGITQFSRHGAGIRIELSQEIVKFDFIEFYTKNENYDTILEIDIYWSYMHYCSLYEEDSNMISELDWREGIELLVNRGVIKKFSQSKCAFNSIN